MMELEVSSVKKMLTPFLILVFIVCSLQVGVVLAKGGQGDSGGSSGSSFSSGQKGPAKDSGKGVEKPQKNQGPDGRELYRESMATLEKEMAASGVTQRFRDRLME